MKYKGDTTGSWLFENGRGKYLA